MRPFYWMKPNGLVDFNDRVTYKQRYEHFTNWGPLISAVLGTCLRQVSRLLILGDDNFGS